MDDSALRGNRAIHPRDSVITLGGKIKIGGKSPFLNTADLAIVPLVRKMTHLPVIFDPSHATGKLLPAAFTAVVVGAHGVMV